MAIKNWSGIFPFQRWAPRIYTRNRQGTQWTFSDVKEILFFFPFKHMFYKGAEHKLRGRVSETPVNLNCTCYECKCVCIVEGKGGGNHDSGHGRVRYSDKKGVMSKREEWSNGSNLKQIATLNVCLKCPFWFNMIKAIFIM